MAFATERLATQHQAPPPGGPAHPDREIGRLMLEFSMAQKPDLNTAMLGLRRQKLIRLFSYVQQHYHQGAAEYRLAQALYLIVCECRSQRLEEGDLLTMAELVRRSARVRAYYIDANAAYRELGGTMPAAYC